MATPSLDDILRRIAQQGVQPKTAPKIPVPVSRPAGAIDWGAVAGGFKNKKAPSGGGGIGGLFGKALSVIDLPRSFITSGVKEMTDLFQGEGFSFRDLASQTKNHYGFGDYLREENINLGKWGNRIAGFVGDVALDPLSYVGGLGVYARARGAKGLTKELAQARTLIQKDIKSLATKGSKASKNDITRLQAKEKALTTAISAAGKKGGSVSSARNALTKLGTKEAKDLIEEAGIQTGLRVRTPGTGPLLGRLTRDSAAVARRRANQIPAMTRNKLESLLPKGEDTVALLKQARRKGFRESATARNISSEAQNILAKAAKMPVEFVPKIKKTFPVGAGVSASIMSSPGLRFEKIAGSKAGQRFGELMVDTQQRYLDRLRRAGGQDPEGILARQRRRDLKQRTNRLARSKEVDDIILSTFFKGAFDRGSATQGHWVSTAMRNRKIFVNEVQRKIGRIDDTTLGKLTSLPSELADDIKAGVPLSPEMNARLAEDFPDLNLNQIAEVIDLFDELVRVPDIEFLGRSDLYGGSAEEAELGIQSSFMREANEVLMGFGGYSPHMLTPEGRVIIETATGGEKAAIKLLGDPAEGLAPAAGRREATNRRVSSHMRERRIKPNRINEAGEFTEGETLTILNADTGEEISTIIGRPHRQGSDVPDVRQITYETDDLGRSGYRTTRRPLNPEEQQARLALEQSGGTVADPLGRTIPEQVDALYREAGYLADDESLFVRGFEPREDSYVRSMAGDVRLASIETYAADQGLIFNADTLAQHGNALRLFDETIEATGAEINKLADNIKAQREVIETIEQMNGALNTDALDDFLEKLPPRSAARIRKEINDLISESGQGMLESHQIEAEIADIARELEIILGVRGITEEGVPGTAFGAEYRLEDPTAFAVDAVRELTPILADLEAATMRLQLLEEGTATMRNVIETIGNMQGQSASDVAEGLTRIADDMTNTHTFIDETLIPYVRNLSEDTMMKDRTIVALKQISESTELAAGLTSKNGITIVQREMNELWGGITGTLGGEGYTIPTKVWKSGLDSPVAELGGKTFRKVMEASNHPNKVNIIKSVDNFVEFRRKIMQKYGLDFDNINIFNGSENPSIFRTSVKTDDPLRWRVDWEMAGEYQSNNILAQTLNPAEQGEFAQLAGGWLDNTVLFDADRAGVMVTASPSGQIDFDELQNFRAAFDLPEESTARLAKTVKLNNKIVKVKGAGNYQVVPSKATMRINQRTKNLLNLAKDPNAVNKITDDQIDLLNDLGYWFDRADFAREPEGFLNDALDELKTQLDKFQTDLNRRREYGKMGFIAETGELGTGDAVTYNYMFDEGLDFDMVRLPTGKGEIRGAQGRLYKINRATGEAIPDVGTFIRRPFNEDTLTLAPQRIKNPDTNRVIQRFHKTMSELGNLEDTLQVHYLSKIDDSVDDILTTLRKRGAILMAEAEEVWGTEGAQRLAYILQPEYSRPRRVFDVMENLDTGVRNRMDDVGRIEPSRAGVVAPKTGRVSGVRTSLRASVRDDMTSLEETLTMIRDPLQPSLLDDTVNLEGGRFRPSGTQSQIDPNAPLQVSEAAASVRLPSVDDPRFWTELQQALDQRQVSLNRGWDTQETLELGLLINQYDTMRGAPARQANFVAAQAIEENMFVAGEQTIQRLRNLEAQLETLTGSSRSVYPSERPIVRVDADGFTQRGSRMDFNKELLARQHAITEMQAKSVIEEQRLIQMQREKDGYINAIGTMLGDGSVEGSKPFNLNSFGGEVDISNITAKNLQEAWQMTGQQMWGLGGPRQFYITGDPIFWDDFTAGMLAAQKMNDPREVNKFLRGYDKIHNWMKAQMVATPGFVIRNLMGGAFNMWLDGIPLNETIKAGNLVRRATAAGKGDLTEGLKTLLRANPKDVELRNALDLVERGVHGGGQAVSSVDINMGKTGKLDFVVGGKNAPAQAKRVRANPLDAGFFMYSAVRNANSTAESAMRLGTALHGMRTGKTFDEAIEQVYKLHFDYGALSSMEMNVMKRAIPFYTWTRKNFPLQISMMAENPGKFNRMVSLKRNMEMGGPEDELVADYILEPFGFKLPFKIGDSVAYATPDLPLQDLIRLDPTAEGGKRALEQITSGASPILKAPLEFFAEKKVYAGIPLKDDWVNMPAAFRHIRGLPEIMKFMSGGTWVEKNSTGEWRINGKILNTLENALPYMARWRRIIPEDRKTQDAWLQTMLSTLGGLSVKINTERLQRGESVRQRIEASEERSSIRNLEREIE
tara:strand:+ start:122 stop:6853 length:6732 start_codon:yes stop_codon:yes gene_type:complete